MSDRGSAGLLRADGLEPFLGETKVIIGASISGLRSIIAQPAGSLFRCLILALFGVVFAIGAAAFGTSLRLVARFAVIGHALALVLPGV